MTRTLPTAAVQEINGESVTTETTGAQSVPAPATTRDGRPDPQTVRGRCPECGDDLVSNMYYTKGHGYILAWECWSSLGDNAACTYRRVL